jgi:hypothetical protein
MLAAGPPSELPARLISMFSAVKAARELGRVNDYSPANRLSVIMIEIDVAVSRLGMTDRRMVMRFTLAATATTGC